MLNLMFGGLCMALADFVPGVSGGTILFILGILVVVLITYFNPISSNSYNISFKYFDIDLMIYIILVAIIAVSAMVLPGISGSTLLLIFGLYLPIMKSVHNILNGNFSQMPIVLVFIVGLIIGIFSCTKLVKYLLQKYTSEMIYIILGLMIGSIYSIIMGPTTITGTYNYVPVNIYNFNVLFFILGGVLIGAIQYLKHLILKQSTDMNLKEID